MVDFSFIVSLYVSDLPNVTISTILVRVVSCEAGAEDPARLLPALAGTLYSRTLPDSAPSSAVIPAATAAGGGTDCSRI